MFFRPLRRRIHAVRYQMRFCCPSTTELTDNNAVAQRLADYLLEHPEIQKVYFIGLPRMGYYSIQSTHFLVPEVIGEDIIAPWSADENPIISASPPVFVLLPDKIDDLAAIRQDYPNGRLHEETTANGELVYWIYNASP